MQLRSDDGYAPERVVAVVARQHDDGLLRSCSGRGKVVVLQPAVQPQRRSKANRVASCVQGDATPVGDDNDARLKGVVDRIRVVADVATAVPVGALPEAT